MEQAEQVAARLLALLREEAEPLVREGRASVHVTTSGEHFGHSGDETAYVLRPTREGALPVCLVPEVKGWCVFPGNGPSLEYWEGSEADYEETRAVVGSVMKGLYRYAFEQRLVHPWLFRWRAPRSVWVLKAFAGDDESGCGEHWGSPPEPGEPLAVQALPY